jgi:hypothetical protein
MGEENDKLVLQGAGVEADLEKLKKKIFEFLGVVFGRDEVQTGMTRHTDAPNVHYDSSTGTVTFYNLAIGNFDRGDCDLGELSLLLTLIGKEDVGYTCPGDNFISIKVEDINSVLADAEFNEGRIITMGMLKLRDYFNELPMGKEKAFVNREIFRRIDAFTNEFEKGGIGANFNFTSRIFGQVDYHLSADSVMIFCPMSGMYANFVQNRLYEYGVKIASMGEVYRIMIPYSFFDLVDVDIGVRDTHAMLEGVFS